MNIKNYILNNWFVKSVYKVKFYIDVSISQISWITGKFPEIMAVVYLADRFGYVLTNNQIIIFAVIFLLALLGFGYIWKHTGIYDVEKYVDAHKNPVTNEILQAARIIIKENKVRK